MPRNSSRSSDSKRHFDWVYHAYQDLLAARALISDKRLYNPVVFHCQQAVEKSLKAFLLCKNRRLLDGHNVTWLCKQAALINPDFASWAARLASLNRLYIETRYPADFPVYITAEEAGGFLSDAEDIVAFVCNLIKFDYNSYRIKNKVNAGGVK
jgi:HEPN domain-containing protein